MSTPTALLDRPVPVPTMVAVVGVQDLTPRIRRVTLSPVHRDRHPVVIGAGSGRNLKLYFPRQGQSIPVLPVAGVPPPADLRPFVRTYTARSYDAMTGHIVVDFVLHEPDGPASAWARSARPGTLVGIAGPRGDPLPEADWYLLMGDESALPFIASALEALPANARGQVLVEVANAGEEQRLGTVLPVSWIHRHGLPPQQSTLLAGSLGGLNWPSKGRILIWAAGEFSAMAQLRRALAGLDLPAPATVLIKRYWTFGVSKEQRRQRAWEATNARSPMSPRGSVTATTPSCS